MIARMGSVLYHKRNCMLRFILDAQLIKIKHGQLESVYNNYQKQRNKVNRFHTEQL